VQLLLLKEAQIGAKSLACKRLCVKSVRKTFAFPFPSILHRLPFSAGKVFAVLALSASDGTVAISTRLLAHRAGISERQARRALRRLIGANLVEVAEPGRGTRPTKYRIRWQLRGFPQPSAASPSHFPSGVKRKNSPRETTAPPRGAAWSDLPIRRPSKALRWTMFRIRREIARWGLPPPRQEALLTGLGQAVWRALRLGLVRTTAQLRRLLHEILAHLREAPKGISSTLRRACAYSGAIVLMGLRAIGALSMRAPIPERPEPDPAEILRRKLEDLRRLYTAPWLSDSDRATIAAEGRRLRDGLAHV